jgi:hypothetical protein
MIVIVITGRSLKRTVLDNMFVSHSLYPVDPKKYIPRSLVPESIRAVGILDSKNEMRLN